jgi:hypothetical protein
MKLIYVLILCVFAVPVGLLAYFHWHTTVLEHSSVIGFKAVETSKPESTVVRISGLSGHSALSIKKITTVREGTSQVVLVHVFLGRSGTSGSFSYDVIVPNSVNEIRFGKERVTIWTRKAGDAAASRIPL